MLQRIGLCHLVITLLWATSVGADTCELRDRVLRPAAAHSAVLSLVQNGEPHKNGGALAWLLRERAAAIQLDFAEAVSGTALEPDEQRLKSFLRSTFELERVDLSESTIMRRQYLVRTGGDDGASYIRGLMEGFDCTTGTYEEDHPGGAGSDAAAASATAAVDSVHALGIALLVLALLWIMQWLSGRGEALHRRYLTSIPASLRVRETVVPTQINNISRMGAQVSVPRDIELVVDGTVELLTGDSTIRSRVAWCNSHNAGLAFAQRVPENLFRTLTGHTMSQRPVQTHRPRRNVPSRQS
ncbi:PilZ domain-containing protein [Roseisalinus antarcticus]|uniref:PilZ domain-containing protein n=1 Tax=Roseisalinus antarcticus TaxID=254357 RepID=A0A1Y5T305_9RHOB|nr:PilZ domain-containing protein [Roseisalinus antarcticus]SLN54642.1 hypothetical protein ROA7023_02456 [Roseisalinus antarcticus]